MSTDNLTPVERVQGQVDELFADPDLELAEVMEQVARLSHNLR